VPADPLKIALYMQGTFYKPNANQQEMDAKLAAAKDIGGSGFGTVILGQWHVPTGASTTATRRSTTCCRRWRSSPRSSRTVEA
jgi:hypothetical protein